MYGQPQDSSMMMNYGGGGDGSNMSQQGYGQMGGGLPQQPAQMMQQQGMGGMGGQMGGLGMGMERVFPCVKLRGLPFDVTEEDIRMFLGCDPVDILMVRRDGRLSGEAYVVLPNPMQVEIACSKNRSYLGRRYIEVFRSKKMDYYKAIVADMSDGGPAMGHPGHFGMGPPMGMGGGYGGGYGGGGMPRGGGYGGGGGGAMPMGPADSGGSTILKLRGLPFSVQDEDIVQWFEDPSLGITPITSDSVFIVHEHGRPSGIAFVEFVSAQEASSAMAKNRQMMGSRYIEIFPANRADLEKYRSNQ